LSRRTVSEVELVKVCPVIAPPEVLLVTGTIVTRTGAVGKAPLPTVPPIV
jgi:hypothetical protein